MRLPTAAIYAFARRADDLADEGELSDNERLAALQQMAQQIETVYNGETVNDPVFIALADSIQRFALPKECFTDLLAAFEQDVNQKRYAEFSELMFERRRIRRRDGARQWTLLHNLENRNQWIERFELPTWAAYVRFHARTTQEDARVGERIRALHRGSDPGLQSRGHRCGQHLRLCFGHHPGAGG